MTTGLHRFQRVIVAITGASGAIYGIRLLEVLHGLPDIETHLVLSKSGVTTIRHELGLGVDDATRLADETHSIAAIGDSIASGSFPVDAMIIAPCSIKTLSSVANSYSADLVSRAADVTLKEGRPLILLVRETPLHVGHLRLMTTAAEVGAVIMPPVPAFYAHPETIEDIVDHTVRRMLSRAGIDAGPPKPWLGLASDARARRLGLRDPDGTPSPTSH